MPQRVKINAPNQLALDDFMTKDIDPIKYFEDFEEGSTLEYQVPGVTPEEIKAFAAEHDPQLFHLDEAVAEKTHFGQLAASGFQTQLKCYRPFCDQVLLGSSSVGAPGIEIKWMRPWYPNQPLEVTSVITRKSISSKSNQRGYVTFEVFAKANGVSILTMEWAVIMLTREGLTNPPSS